MLEGDPIILSAAEKLEALGVSGKVSQDKVERLQRSPDLETLRNNIRETSLSVPQFLSLLFKGLYPQVRQRVAERLKNFNLTPEMLDYLFTEGAGEPFIIFWGEYPQAVKERQDEFVQAVKAIMLEELRTYLF